MKKKLNCKECSKEVVVKVCCDGSSCDCKGLPEDDVICSECRGNYVEEYTYNEAE